MGLYSVKELFAVSAAAATHGGAGDVAAPAADEVAGSGAG
jgi:hypothetical protein